MLCRVVEPGEKRTLRADRKTTLTLITTLYDHGEQKSISEFTCRTLLMKYNSTTPHQVSLLYSQIQKCETLTTEMFEEKKEKRPGYIVCVCSPPFTFIYNRHM